MAEVTACPLFCFLLARSKSQVPPTLMGRRFYKGMNTGRWELWGHLAVYSSQVMGKKVEKHCSREKHRRMSSWFWGRQRFPKQIQKALNPVGKKKDKSAYIQKFYSSKGFPGGSDSKASTCNAVDLGSIPGLGRSSGKGSPLQYSCLENSMNGGAW